MIRSPVPTRILPILEERGIHFRKGRQTIYRGIEISAEGHTRATIPDPLRIGGEEDRDHCGREIYMCVYIYIYIYNRLKFRWILDAGLV